MCCVYVCMLEAGAGELGGWEGTDYKITALKYEVFLG